MTRAAFLLLAFASHCLAQRYFVTALGGVSTLSADAATRFNSNTEVSLYKPENGPALNLAAGVHLNDWFSFQANYIWNRNDVLSTEVRDNVRLEQTRGVSQHTGVADLLVYFRDRRSWLRPYLSAGVAVVRMANVPAHLASGGVTSFVEPGARVAVGADLVSQSGWGFRYSFSETISRNPISRALSPPGSRRLANFQNLFGFVKYF